jgi:hypothetical protein
MGQCKKFLAPVVICGPSGMGKGNWLGCRWESFQENLSSPYWSIQILGKPTQISTYTTTPSQEQGYFVFSYCILCPTFGRESFLVWWYFNITIFTINEGIKVLSTFILVSWIAALLSSKLEFSVICYRDVWFEHSSNICQYWWCDQSSFEASPKTK